MQGGGFVQGGYNGPAYPGDGWGPRYEQRDNNDPLKKVVLLSGVTSGQINPLTAVAMDRNNGMSAADTALVSSLGDGASTVVALSGGLGGRSGSGGLFGGSGGSGSSSSNLLTTMVVANALTPKTSTTAKKTQDNSAATSLATFALLSKMQDNHDDYHGYNGYPPDYHGYNGPF